MGLGTKFLCFSADQRPRYEKSNFRNILKVVILKSAQRGGGGPTYNQYLFQTAYITLSHSRYKIDIGYSLGWHQRYETCQGCNPLKFHESDIHMMLSESLQAYTQSAHY